MRSSQHIVLSIPPDTEFGRGVIQGIIRFAGVSGWLLTQCHSGRDAFPADAAGIIAAIETPGRAEELKSHLLPCVNVSSAVEDGQMPRAVCDDRMIGSLAAGHFLERGMRHFGFVKLTGRADSQPVLSGFVDRLAIDGFTKVLIHEMPQSPGSDVTELCQWLQSLPKPCGLFAPSDAAARWIIDACRLLSLAIPAQVAVLGCGNDGIICGLASPSLSSVALPGERVGYAAAELLEQFLQGKPPVEKFLQLPVSSVIARGSTDTVAIRDHYVATAVQFILAHAGEWIGVRELQLAIPIQRRTLERKFKQILGRTPLAEIRRVRVNLACQILASTDLPMPQVARRAGFSEAKQLSTVFRQHMGMTPTEYRARFRLEEEATVPPPGPEGGQ